MFMIIFNTDVVVLSLIATVIIFGFNIFDLLWTRNLSKPEFRKSEDGYLEYKSKQFKPIWKKVTVWSEKSEDRIVQIFDSIRNRKYKIKYNGPGRKYISYDSDWKTTIKERYKTIGELDKYQNEVLNIESDYLSKQFSNDFK